VRNPFILIFFGPVYQFMFKHRFPWDLPRAWKREWWSVHWTNVVLVAVTVTMWLTLGLWEFLAVQLPILLISGSLGIYLFYVQHQFEDTYWERQDRWSFGSAALEGSSYFKMPAWLHWLTGNIGIHHVHHLCSRIPNYRLRRVLKDNPELEEAAPKLTVWQSFRCLRLKLWDEKERRLVGFREVRRRFRAAQAAARIAA
jgi:omega-6 fatty acid desaturase (delta-12 desaturase)